MYMYNVCCLWLPITVLMHIFKVEQQLLNVAYNIIGAYCRKLEAQVESHRFSANDERKLRREIDNLKKGREKLK